MRKKVLVFKDFLRESVRPTGKVSARERLRTLLLDDELTGGELSAEVAEARERVAAEMREERKDS